MGNFTGNPDQFDGKNHGFRLRFSHQNQSIEWLVAMWGPLVISWFISPRNYSRGRGPHFVWLVIYPIFPKVRPATSGRPAFQPRPRLAWACHRYRHCEQVGKQEIFRHWDDMIIIPVIYPLVSIQKTMERSTVLNGKTHYKSPFSIANC